MKRISDLISHRPLLAIWIAPIALLAANLSHANDSHDTSNLVGIVVDRDGAIGKSRAVRNNVRTFSHDLDMDGMGDAVIFESATSAMTVCFNGPNLDCRRYAIEAEDVLRWSAVDVAFIAFTRQHGAQACSMTGERRTLSCRNTTLRELDAVHVVDGSGRNYQLVQSNTGPLGEACLVYESGIASCASARPMDNTSQQFLGYFEQGGSLARVTIEPSRNSLCGASGSGSDCHPAFELAALRSHRFVGAARIMSDGRHALVGLSDGYVTVCAHPLKAEGLNSAFLCASKALNASLANYVPFVTARIGAVERDSISLRPADSPAKSLAHEVATISWRSEIEHAYRTALKDLTRELEYSFGTTTRLSVAGRSKVFEDNDPGNDSWESGPAWMSADGFTEPFGYWTDMYGYYFWDFDRDRNQQQCMIDCAADDQMMDANCATMGVLAAAVGLAATAGATVGAAMTGPGAFGVAVGGFGLSADAATLVYMACQSIRPERRRQCELRCR